MAHVLQPLWAMKQLFLVATIAVLAACTGRISAPLRGALSAIELCPEGGSFPAGSDAWSPLITIHTQTGGGLMAPVHTSLLPSGRLVMWGRGGPAETDAFFFTPSVDECPGTADCDVFVPSVRPAYQRKDGFLFCAGQTFLANGSLFVAGGITTDFVSALEYAQTVSPDGSFAPVGPVMSAPRYYPGMTRLPNSLDSSDARIMATAGYRDVGATPVFSVELYDPALDSWTVLAPDDSQPPWQDIGATGADYTQVHVLPIPVALEGGYVGREVMLGAAAVPFLFDHGPGHPDPADRFRARSIRPAAATALRGSWATSAMLSIKPGSFFPPGSLLVAGGGDEETDGRADIYVPSEDRWCTGIAALGGHYHPTSLLLPDGRIGIFNGFQFGTQGADHLRRAYIIDPDTGALYVGSTWPDANIRGYHNVAVLLPDARVLVGAGSPTEFTVGDERSDARIWTPPYLAEGRAGVRPIVSALPGGSRLSYGASLPVAYESGPIQRASLVGLSAQTHAFNFNQRHIEVEISGGTEGSGTLGIAAPATPEIAPAGPYLLFLMKSVDGWDVPSVGEVVMVGPV